VVVCCCGGVLLWWSVVVVVCCCGGVMLWWCAVVVVCCCGGVLLWCCGDDTCRLVPLTSCLTCRLVPLTSCLVSRYLSISTANFKSCLTPTILPRANKHGGQARLSHIESVIRDRSLFANRLVHRLGPG
jgi:hypothetical protein